jgi:chemotaxis family two-component system response regulator Rcp1
MPNNGKEVTTRPNEILIVDDSPAGARLMTVAFSECKIPIHTNVLHDPTDILLYLQAKEKFRDAARPDLIIVDYKMPLDGGVALAQIKGNPDYQCIPVIVVTGSHDPNHIHEVYRCRANICYRKPSDLDGLTRWADRIAHNWLGDMGVILPPAKGNLAPSE